jgi:glycosyltransferase involved in cell wall biosynthesis
MSDPLLSVIIAARNEEAYLGRCLGSLLTQDAVAGPVEIIVAANACTDGTVGLARSFEDRIRARGWKLQVLDLEQGGKVRALNAADHAARGSMRIYLDADVWCEPALLGQLRGVLDQDEARYATGRLAVARADSAITRAYARIWTRLPFVQGGAVGAGLFAMNGAGRARWGDWPDIISDDTFARLNFSSSERIEVPARYHWPMVEGLQNLIRVRRRQDAGVQEVYRLYPQLRANEGKATVGRSALLRLFLSDPAGFLLYSLVHAAVRLRPPGQDWTRGR